MDCGNATARGEKGGLVHIRAGRRTVSGGNVTVEAGAGSQGDGAPLSSWSGYARSGDAVMESAPALGDRTSSGAVLVRSGNAEGGRSCALALSSGHSVEGSSRVVTVGNGNRPCVGWVAPQVRRGAEHGWPVTLTAGNATSGQGGRVSLDAGRSGSGAGGDLELRTGGAARSTGSAVRVTSIVK